MGQLIKDFTRGIWEESAVFRLILGMCPTLAVTNSAVNGLVMGSATTFVLVSASIIISIFRKFIPSKVRIPIFIVVTASFVTIADYLLAAFIPSVHKILGIYVPLIVVNCVILGRLEAFSSKNPVSRSFFDALGIGVGFTLGLLSLSSMRELLGNGTIFSYQILNQEWFNPMLVMKLPPGAFLTLAFLIATINYYTQRKKKSRGDKKEDKCKNCSCGGCQ